MIFYIIVIVLWGYLLSIFGVYYYKLYKQLPRKKFFSLKTLGIPLGTVLVIVIPVILINLQGEVYLLSPEDYIENGNEIEDESRIVKGELLQLNSDTLNIDYHFELVKHVSEEKLNLVHNKLRKWYKLFSSSDNSDIRDISFLMRGFFDYYKGRKIDYAGSFDKVQNDSLKYLSYGYGLVYMQDGDFEKAETFFRKEIAHNGSLKEATIALFSLYYELGEAEKLHELAYDKQLIPYLGRPFKMDTYYRDGAWIPYFREALGRHYQLLNWFGFLGALLASLVWIWYLKSLDVFEPEKWRNIITAFLMGSVFVLLVYPFSDSIEYYLNLRFTGGSWMDFVYCVVDIGMVEELVKFIPWFLLLKFTNIIDEPFDYILYAALSGAGFAFAENLIYFQEADLSIIFVRATYCIVGHMFWSSTIAYGYVLYKYKYKAKRSKMYLIPLSFLIAATAHGLYDFLIFENIGMYSIFFFIGSLHLFVIYQNNALNVSNHFSYQVKLNTRKIGVQLIFGLITVFMYQYVVIGLRYGNDDANDMVMYSAMSVSFMLAYLTYTFSQIKISKGTWLKMAMPKWAVFLKRGMENYRIGGVDYMGDNNYEEEIEEENLVGMKIRFFAPKENPYLGSQLPVTGVLIKKMEVSGNDDWYLVLLDSDLHVNHYLKDRVIIRHKNKGQSLDMDKVLIYLMMIPSEYELQKDPLLTRDLIFTGRVYSRPVG